MTMLRHIAVMLALTTAALGAGVYMVPGSREQWTMLIRDERNAEALDLLEQRYQAGERDPEALLQLYKLLMSFAQIDRATQVVQEFASQRPGDIFALTLLARHYHDTQDAHHETATLERLFAVQPSPTTAQRLLVLYRLAGHPSDEKGLLEKMLADAMISAGDAERLGFMLAAEGDLPGARQALLAFDSMATPESSTGRLALFDILLRLGESNTAMAMAERWLSQRHLSHLDQGFAGRDFPLSRLIQLMAHVDPADTKRIVCDHLPAMASLDLGAFSMEPSSCTPPEQANGSVEIDGEDLAQPSVIVTTKRNEGDRSTH
jgi:tetratricopeptide (TPR) repeat protein